MKKCPDIDDVKVPWMIEKLLDDGYVVWFTDGLSTRDGCAKKGQQFWLEDGELTTHNVDPRNSKEVKTGWHAWRKLKSELEDYARWHFNFRIIGERCWHTYNNGDWKKRTIKEAVLEALKYTLMPKPHFNFSPYELIGEMVSNKVLTYHKRKQPNTKAFRASDAKVAVFQWLHKRYSNAIIVPEFGLGGMWGKTSIVDLAVFDEKKMIFVEIKAETDLFVRVQKQLEVSSQFADEVWLALFEEKSIPKDIPLYIGIISFDRNGKIKIIQKAKTLKQDKTVIGHIWTKELHDSFACYEVENTWLKSFEGGLEELTKVAQDILGKNSRQFTINTLRNRHYLEYVWRRDLLLKGDTGVISIGRGKKENISSSYFYQNYNYQEHGLHEAGLKELAIKQWTPPVSKHEKRTSVKEKMLRPFEEFKAKNGVSA